MIIEAREEVFDIDDIDMAEDVVYFAPTNGPTERRNELINHFENLPHETS